MGFYTETKTFCDQCGIEANPLDHKCIPTGSTRTSDDRHTAWEAWKSWGESLRHAMPCMGYPPDARIDVPSVILVGDGGFESRELFNPTWGEVVLEFDRSIDKSGDTRRVCLDGIRHVQGKVWVFAKRAEFRMT